MLNRLHIAAALALGAAMLITPAYSEVSLSQARKICEGAAKVLRPAPRSARLDRYELNATATTMTFYLNVQTAEDAKVKVSCTVDRATGVARLTPSTLAPPPASAGSAP